MYLVASAKEFSPEQMVSEQKRAAVHCHALSQWIKLLGNEEGTGGRQETREEQAQRPNVHVPAAIQSSYHAAVEELLRHPDCFLMVVTVCHYFQLVDCL
jgi:hypothetical protein